MFLSPINTQEIQLSIHKPFGLLFYYFYEGTNLLDDLQVFWQKFCNNYKIRGNIRELGRIRGIGRIGIIGGWAIVPINGNRQMPTACLSAVVARRGHGPFCAVVGWHG